MTAVIDVEYRKPLSYLSSTITLVSKAGDWEMRAGKVVVQSTPTPDAASTPDLAEYRHTHPPV